MRRFDKKQVIKESNELLEKKYLVSKNYILEENPTIATGTEEPMDDATAGTTAVTTKTKEKDVGDVNTEDFELFKKELKAKGSSTTIKNIVIPGSNGKKIDIRLGGIYVIKASDGNQLQVGTFKSKGIWPTKHIELTPLDKPNIEYKLKNILIDIDKEASEKTPLNFYDTLQTIVSKPKNIIIIDDGFRYTYYVNTKNSIITSYVVDFTDESDGAGKFKIGYLTGKVGKWITNSEGTFTDFGKTLKIVINKDSKSPTTKVFSDDKNGKIDAALMGITGIIKPEFKG